MPPPSGERTEPKLAALLEHLAENITVVDGAGRVRFALRWPIPGVPAREGTCVLDLLHPEDRATAAAVLERVAGGEGEAARVTVRLTDGQGGWRVLDCRVIHRVSDPAVGGVVLITRDITRDVQALNAAGWEQQLERQQAAVLRIFDALPLLISVHEPDGRISFVNRCWQETSGWTLADAQQPWFTSRAIVDGVLPDIASAQVDGTPRWLELAVRKASGELLLLMWTSQQLADGRWVGISRDVTAARLEADRLRESEERYRLMVERSEQVFFYTHDLAGVFEYLSPSVQAVLGYDPAELVGRSYMEVVPAEQQEEVAERTRTSFEQRGPMVPYEVYNRHRDGRLIRVELAETPILRAGEVIGMQGFARDVTQLRQLEQQVQHAQRMEAIGRLAGGVAHDMNNILTVIDGNADLGLLDPDLSEALRSALQQIHQATERGARLTRQLLAFSRKQVVQRVPLDLNASVQNARAMLERLIGDSVVMQLHLSEQPAWILADPGQVEQVLVNLAVNARDAMPAGGRLQFRTRRARPGENPRFGEGGWLLLEVEDEGEGIPEDVLPHIFEPFFTTRTASGGTGLGLATSYAIVEASGGWMDVRSELGRGSCFRVFLPEQAAPAACEPAAPVAAARGGGETLLLVEDDASVRTVVRQSLRRLGYTVVTAENGRDALHLLARHPEVALIVTDVMMPIMGGVELAEHLRHLRPDVPLLFISGYTDDAPELSSAGSAPLLHKPFSTQQLAGVIRSLLDDTRLVPASL